MGIDLKEMNSEATFIFVGRVFQTGGGSESEALVCSHESRASVAGNAHAKEMGSSTVSKMT